MYCSSINCHVNCWPGSSSMIAENTGHITIFRYNQVNSYSVASARRLNGLHRVMFRLYFLDQEPIFSRRINFSVHIMSALHWLSRLNAFQIKLRKAQKNRDRKKKLGVQKGAQTRRGSRRGPNGGGVQIGGPHFVPTQNKVCSKENQISKSEVFPVLACSWYIVNSDCFAQFIMSW